MANLLIRSVWISNFLVPFEEEFPEDDGNNDGISPLFIVIYSFFTYNFLLFLAINKTTNFLES